MIEHEHLKEIALRGSVAKGSGLFSEVAARTIRGIICLYEDL
jgi:hypothetical protein